MQLQAAKCPECGAEIQVPSDRSTIKCMYCGKDILVPQAIAAAGSPPVENLIQLAQAAEEAGNHEEAFSYWNRVLEVDPENLEAWIGKALSAGWQSNLLGDRLGEMVSGIERGLQLAGDFGRDLAEATADQALAVVQAYYGISIDHTMKYIEVDSAWPEHIDRVLSMIDTMQKVIEWSPKDVKLHTETLDLVDNLLKGIEYPKGEFAEGYEYLNVPPELRPRLENLRADLIARIKVQDPTYVPKKVKPVKGPGCGCQIVVILVLLVIAAIALYYFMKFSRGDF